MRFTELSLYKRFSRQNKPSHAELSSEDRISYVDALSQLKSWQQEDDALPLEKTHFHQYYMTGIRLAGKKIIRSKMFPFIKSTQLHNNANFAWWDSHRDAEIRCRKNSEENIILSAYSLKLQSAHPLDNDNSQYLRVSTFAHEATLAGFNIIDSPTITKESFQEPTTHSQEVRFILEKKVGKGTHSHNLVQLEPMKQHSRRTFLAAGFTALLTTFAIRSGFVTFGSTTSDREPTQKLTPSEAFRQYAEQYTDSFMLIPITQLSLRTEKNSVMLDNIPISEHVESNPPSEEILNTWRCKELLFGSFIDIHEGTAGDIREDNILDVKNKYGESVLTEATRKNPSLTHSNSRANFIIDVRRIFKTGQTIYIARDVQEAQDT